MKVITARLRVAGIAARWRRAYQGPDGKWPGGPEYERKAAALDALGPDPSPEAVAAIVGDWWCATGACNGCGSDDDAPRVEVGEEPNYESSTARLCLACVEKAAKALREAVEKENACPT